MTKKHKTIPSKTFINLTSAELAKELNIALDSCQHYDQLLELTKLLNLDLFYTQGETQQHWSKRANKNIVEKQPDLISIKLKPETFNDSTTEVKTSLTYYTVFGSITLKNFSFKNIDNASKALFNLFRTGQPFQCKIQTKSSGTLFTDQTTTTRTYKFPPFKKLLDLEFQLDLIGYEHKHSVLNT